MRLSETVVQDVRYGFRVLRLNPGFTAVAVLSLALGIGANTAIFSVMDALLLRMLPIPRAEELVRFRSSLSFPAYLKIRDQNQTLSGVFAYSFFPASVRVGDNVEQSISQMVSGNFYPTMGVNAAVGRLLSPEDDRIPGSGGPDGPVGVLSYQYWERRFGLDPTVVGKVLVVNGVAVTIVGVAPKGFFGVLQWISPDVTVPIMLQPRVFPSSLTELWVHGDEGSILAFDLKDDYGPQLMARVKPDVSMTQAEAELNVLYQGILAARAGSSPDAQRPRDAAERKIELVPAGSGFGLFPPQQRAILLLVMAAVPGVVLLIACANVANLLLARAAGRQKEVVVRLAVGSGRGRLIRQLLTESVLLALGGGALGLLLAGWGRRLLLGWMTASLPVPISIAAQTDARVLGFTLVASVLSALVFGLVPAFRATKADLAPMLKEGGRSLSTGRGWHTAKLLVAAQVALSLLLLVCAGLFIRTVRNLEMFDAGYDIQQLYTVSTNFLGYKGPQTGTLVKQIWERVEQLPGASAVGITQDFPPFDRRLNVTVEGVVPERFGEKMYVDRLLVGPGFLETLGVPLLSGRSITPRDDENAPKICVVSAAMARTFFPNGDPIGRHFTFQRTGAEYEVEIVGVVKDLKKAEDTADPWRPVYCPMLQDLPLGGANVLVRTSSPDAVLADVRRHIQGVDRNLFVDVKTMERQVEDRVFLQRFVALLSGAFGLLALLLASVGLYGVMAYSVARRTNEIGIRMALGANRGHMIGLVVGDTMRLVAGGVLAGLIAAWGATRLIASGLFGLTAMDPATIVSAVVVLTIVALLAGYIPARRAAGVDPLIALRQE